MLTTHTVAPVVTETSVETHALHLLNVVTELCVELVDEEVSILTVSRVALSVEEPAGNLVLGRVLNDGDDTLKLVNAELTSTLGHVDVGLLADEVGEPGANTTDGSQGVHDFDVTIDVSRQKTQNMLEVVLLRDRQRHFRCVGEVLVRT